MPVFVHSSEEALGDNPIEELVAKRQPIKRGESTPTEVLNAPMLRIQRLGKPGMPMPLVACSTGLKVALALSKELNIPTVGPDIAKNVEKITPIYEEILDETGNEVVGYNVVNFDVTYIKASALKYNAGKLET